MKVDLNIYSNFESCPVGAWCENVHFPPGTRLMYKYGEKKHHREIMGSNEACDNIRNLIAIARKAPNMEVVVERAAPPLPSDARRIDSETAMAIRETGAAIIEAMAKHAETVAAAALNIPLESPMREMYAIADKLRPAARKETP